MIYVLFCLLVCLLVNCRLKEYAPKATFLYALAWCIVANCRIRDQLPIGDVLHKKRTDEDTILMTVVICHALNYNSFVWTLLIQMPLSLLSYYFQLLYMVEVYHDPYTQ